MAIAPKTSRLLWACPHTTIPTATAIFATTENNYHFQPGWASRSRNPRFDQRSSCKRSVSVLRESPFYA